MTNSSFQISRVIAAPIDRVFEAFTSADAIKAWFGPPTCPTVECAVDFRHGGKMHYKMQSDDGQEHWGLWRIERVMLSERLQFVSSFSDPDGNVTRAPFNEKWPLEMPSAITFEEAPGGTKVTVSSDPSEAPDEERAVFTAGFSMMEEGWNGCFDRLQEWAQSDATVGPALLPVDCFVEEGWVTISLTKPYEQSPTELWTTLTDPAEFSKCVPMTFTAFGKTEGEPVVFKDDFAGESQGKVTEYEEGKKFAFEDATGEQELFFEVKEAAEGSQLVFEHTFPDGFPRGMMAVQGHACLNLFEGVLSKKEVGIGVTPSMEALYEDALAKALSAKG